MCFTLAPLQLIQFLKSFVLLRLLLAIGAVFSNHESGPSCFWMLGYLEYLWGHISGTLDTGHSDGIQVVISPLLMTNDLMTVIIQSINFCVATDTTNGHAGDYSMQWKQ